MATTKILQGVIRITENGDYNLVLPSNGARAQNDLAINNIEEVYVIVENIAEPIAVNINLPKISDFNGGWNCKMYLLNKNNFFDPSSICVINAYSSELYSDYINGESGISFSNNPMIYYDNRYLFMHILDNNYWLALAK
jgi:hypothetical protein